MEGEGSLKSGRSESDLNGQGAFKNPRQEFRSLPTGRGSKSKPCGRFFSTVGCPYGDKCFFSHYIPNGTKSCLCYKFYTARGCSDYCVFAHGGEELRKPITYMGPLPFTGFEHLIPPVPVFRGHVQTKRSLVAPRDTMRMETWLVSRMSGAKISFEDHESDPSRVNVKMEGTLDDVNLATYLVRQYISCAGPKHVPQPAPSGEASFPH